MKGELDQKKRQIVEKYFTCTEKQSNPDMDELCRTP